MKKLLLIIAILLVVSAAGIGVTSIMKSNNDEGQEELKIVTSFYPTYVATKNIADGIDGVSVVNLTENHSGCLHDYQLTTSDMRKLEGADIFVMNGGGMESFLEDVVAKYPDLTIIDASEGIELLEPTAGHSHEHGEETEDAHVEEHSEEDEHDHESEPNAHVWMNPEYYEVQLNNIANGLSEAYTDYSESFNQNKEAYIQKVDDIKAQLDELKTEQDTEIIIFHEAFAYLADYLGLDVVYCLDLDDESGLSAGAIAEVIDEVEEHNIKILFTETEYKDSIATNISAETEAKVYVLTSLTSEEDSIDAYIDGMQANIDVLKQILADS